MSPTAQLLQVHAASLRAQAATLVTQAAALEQLATLPAEVAPAPSTPYLTLKQLCARHPAFRESSVREWLTQRNINGLATCVRELGTKGGKLLIDEAAFLRWVDQHTPKGVSMTPHHRRRA